MKRRIASILPMALILSGLTGVVFCLGGIAGTLTMTSCATVANDPVATNAARFKDENHRVAIVYEAWAKALEADTRRDTPVITPERRNQVKQIRLQIDALMNEWSQSVAAGRPFSWSDSAVSMLNAMAQFAEEASR